MEDGLFTKQGKKLLMIGVFLWFVAALVGREEDPGVIANLAEDGSAPSATAAAPMPVVAQPSASVVRKPAPAPRRQDPGLSSWYAEADSGGGAMEPTPVAPTPVDNSHLVNDARPIAAAAPIG
ncbi:hypothetical protein [Qipengyuania flava]|uniref:hypothetical protein n=1 Tax=Qipengyuania flava TaxID=192812 RepID=UPI001C638839|nr:hypothetical protein [Qipengyuania flava]QYJ07115.1 hypothetical protein KUV82_13960 [Qipengyuania flava]